MTANRREEIAAPDISASDTMRSSEAALALVKNEGSGNALDIELDDVLPRQCWRAIGI